MKKNNNIKIAKELIKIAKNLIQNEKTAKWNWKHPFSFIQKHQEIYNLENEIKNGKIEDTILIKLTEYKNKGESNIHIPVDKIEIKGEIVKPKNISIISNDFMFSKINGNKIIIYSYEPWSGDKYSWFEEYPHSLKTSDGFNIVWGFLY